MEANAHFCGALAFSFCEEWEDLFTFARRFICTLDLYISQIRVQILYKNSRSLALKLQFVRLSEPERFASVLFYSHAIGGLSRKDPSNARVVCSLYERQ